WRPLRMCDPNQGEGLWGQAELQAHNNRTLQHALLPLQDTLVLAWVVALQFALLPLQDTPVLAQVSTLVVWQSAPHTLLRLASTPTGTPHWGIIPTGTPHWGIIPTGTPRWGIIPTGTPHWGIIPTGTRSTIRSTIRRSSASTMKASPLVVRAAQAAQAAQAAVLTLTKGLACHTYSVVISKT
ncbi:hypothetical protein DV515_00013660, partial [Chloebia gouldiae]